MQRLFRPKWSFEVRDVASYAGRIGWRCFPVEGGLDGIFEFVCGGGGARASEILAQGINTPLVEQVMIGVKNSRFRRDLYLSLRDQCVVWIEQRGEFIAVVTFMLANFICGSRPAGIDEPQGHFGSISRANSLNQRRIAVGDRAVTAYEDEHNRLSRSCQKGICRGAVEMQSCLLGAE